MKEFLLAISIAVTAAASCTGTVTQDDPPPPGSDTLPAAGLPSTPEVSDPPSPAIRLAGTSWLLTIVDGGDWPVGDDPKVELSFGDTHVSWSVGCNLYNAKWKMADGHIELGRGNRIFSTLVRCDKQVQRIEERLVHILSASPAVGNGGDSELRLTSRDGVLVFARSD